MERDSMKALILFMDGCIDCPYKDYDYHDNNGAEFWKCDHPDTKYDQDVIHRIRWRDGKRLDKEENKKLSTIPEWCPLPEVKEEIE